MRITFACDHAGFQAKDEIIKLLKDLGHEVNDNGCFTNKPCNYPEFGIPAAKKVANGEADRAILVCGNGIGMSILANKIKGCIAALVYSQSTAEATRKHHNSNVLCLGAREFSADALIIFIRIWLSEK